MIDQTRAIVAAAVVAAVALLAIGVGFAAGRATSDSNTNETTSDTPDVDRDGDGLPAGPARVENDIPMGFAPTEDGAIAAAATWVPLVVATPSSERPEAIAQVFGRDVNTSAVERESTGRVSTVPVAGQVSMRSETDADVSLVMETVAGDWNSGEMGFELLEVVVALSWDDSAADWRLADVAPEVTEFDDWPISAAEVAGYRAVRPTGVELGGVLVEDVPGE